MKFEWNPEKNKINIKKHGIDFADVATMFNHPMLTLVDNRQNYGEDRWVGIGMILDITAVVVFVEKCGDTIRIISARKANKHEEKKYKEALRH